MSLNTAYFSAVTTSVAICTAKLTFIHLLTARERLHTGSFVRSKDANILSPVRNVLKALLGAFGPSFGGQEFCDRCERITKNIAENETLFFLMSIGFGLSSVDSDGSVESALQLVHVYTMARVAHTLIYLFDMGGIIALRGIAWTVGSLCNIAMAAMIFQGTVSSQGANALSK